jgi:hypothetical protein
MKRSTHLVATSLFVASSLGCPSQVPPLDSSLPPPEFELRKHPVLDASAAPPEAAPSPALTSFDRASFNRWAVRGNLPLYWVGDLDRDGAVDPDEVTTLLFYGRAPRYVEAGGFTEAFFEAYRELEAHRAMVLPDSPDAQRRALVGQDLDAATPILVRTDLRAAPAEERDFVRHMHAAALTIDALHELQSGVAQLRSKVAPDPESQSLFRRNGSLACKTPKLESDPRCTASVDATREEVDVYPSSLQKDPKFCAALEKHPDAKKLLTPFSVVREQGGKLVGVPYHQAYAEPMRAVAGHLRAAAKALASPTEGPMRNYLEAAARAFETDDWHAADEAWAKMNATNSRYYLRVGPDETYWEPCSQKAGFHMSFARIDQRSLAMQARLSPHQQAMEEGIAKLAGAPYEARKAGFHLPDFIEIVFNAGDSRGPVGATIGQSLPNWGPVANESRGRTVAMTNLYADPDSLAVRRERAATMLAAETLSKVTDDPSAGLFSTVLHEAAHNLGPSHEYAVGGKKDDQVFGGDLASMLEELKAQSGALYLPVLLQERGAMSAAEVEQAWADSIVWCFGHVARGMYTPGGARKAYSQLSAIQLGFLMDEGAVVFDPEAVAANGKDKGAFRIDFAKMPAAVTKLMKEVAGIKARGDKKRALELAKKYVDGTRVPQKLIEERVLRFAQPSFVYAVDGLD